MILFKKAVRSILSNKRAYLSCVVLITFSVFMFTAMGGAARSLSDAAKRYYSNNRFADVFAKVKSIDYAGVLNLEEIEGIDEVLPRLTYDARVLIPDNPKIITVRLISFDKDYEGTPLNAVNYNGDGLQNENDILVLQAFLDVHGLKPYDNLTMIIEGKEATFSIASGAISPEYVYAVSSLQELLPDKETFGIAYIDRIELEQLTSRVNEYNDLSFSLEKGYTFDDVKKNLEDELDEYGLLEIVKQKDQISANMLDTEINSVSAMSSSVPILFSGMAAIVLYLMLKRVIEQERTQIGTLKAFGYSNNTLLLHYIFYGLITSFVGGVLGIILGDLSIPALVNLYAEYFILPDVSNVVPLDLAVIGLGIALLSGIIGAFAGAKSILSLNPADSMKPPAPPPIKSDIIKKLPFLIKILSSRGNMAVRNIMRSKVRSIFIAAGIMISFGMVATISSMNELTDAMFFTKFKKIEIYDAKLSLSVPASTNDAIEQTLAIDGVYLAEGMNQVFAEMRLSNRKENAVILGLNENSSLYKIYDDLEKVYKKPLKNEIILNKTTADKLCAVKGDYIYVATPYNDDEIKLVVGGIVNQNMSAISFMEIDSLNQMLDLNDISNTVIVRTDRLDVLKDYVTDAKNVYKIEDTKSIVENFNQSMGSYSTVIQVLTLMSGIIAFAIIYNTSTISLSEKKREYATLRVLGLQVNEVCEILSFEYWTLLIVGAAVGFPFTRWLSYLINEMVSAQMDSITLPQTTSLSAYNTAILVCVAAVFFSNLSAKQNIKKFDMVEVLKERE